jgi:hypothetical protein
MFEGRGRYDDGDFAPFVPKTYDLPELPWSLDGVIDRLADPLPIVGVDTPEVLGDRRARPTLVGVDQKHRREPRVRIEGVGLDVPVEDADHARRIEGIGQALLGFCQRPLGQDPFVVSTTTASTPAGRPLSSRTGL